MISSLSSKPWAQTPSRIFPVAFVHVYSRSRKRKGDLLIYRAVVGQNQRKRSITFGRIHTPIRWREGMMRFEAAWVHLFVAGLLEIVWAVGLKSTEGFSRVWPSVVTICAMIASFALLAQALKTIPVGTGYAVWTGIGAAGTAIIGMIFLGESAEILRILCLAFIVAGVVGLKFVSTTAH